MKNWQLASAIVGGLAALVAISAAVNQAGDESSPPGTRVPLAPQTVVVEYDVSGTVESANVTMSTPTGTQQESPDVPLMFGGQPGRYTFTFNRGEFVYISAQKPRETGTITCEIRVAGVIISHNTSTAGYGIATCSGSAD